MTSHEHSFEWLAHEHSSLDRLLRQMGRFAVHSLHAPYPSDHARTILVVGPAAGPRREPTHVLKLARRASAEPYMHNAALLRAQLPERFGRLRLVLPQWEGRVGGRLATIERHVAGRRVGRGAVGELLREWLALSDAHGGAVAGLGEERVDPAALADFLARRRLGAPLAALLERHAAWLRAEPTFCHGDLSHLNIMRRGGDLFLFDWDFCRRAGLRRFDGLYALLVACLPLTTYARLAVRFRLQMGRHGHLIGWRAPAEEALALVLTFLALHSEVKERRAAPPAGESPYLAMLRAGWAVRGRD